jgi:hypothetical protein
MKPSITNKTLPTQKVKYDTSRFNFRKVIQDQLQQPDLENLHQHVDDSDKVVERKTDQASIWHKRYYAIGSHFFELYDAFIRDYAVPFFGEAVVYQKFPTFRVHYPNNLGVGEFHRDRDYAHNQSEVNFWLPFTRTFDSNTIWIESEEGKEDYAPIEVEIGEVAIFNGCHLKHGNKINRTGQTRVSFDFRVIPHSQYTESAGASINTKMEFKIGSYYKLMPA